ncbi:MAG: alpha/beta fold hydrolase [Candidatus Binatia bacterium]
MRGLGLGRQAWHTKAMADTAGVQLEAYDFPSHYADLPEGRIHYLDEGQGPVLLMLHGNPTWSFLYRHLVRGLRDRFRCIAVDHLGFGLSDKPATGDYTIPGHIRRMEQLVDALGLERVTPVVQDWGGPIGLTWAVEHRARVDRLVVMNTFAFNVRPADVTLSMLLAPLVLGVVRLPGVGEVLIRRLNIFVRRFVPGVIQDPARKTPGVMRGYLFPYPDYTSRAAILQFPREIPFTSRHPNWMLLANLEAKLRGWQLPALIVWGQRDPAFAPSITDRFAALLPNHRIVRIEHAGHFLQEEAPEAIIEAIGSFFEDRGVPAGGREPEAPRPPSARPEQ